MLHFTVETQEPAAVGTTCLPCCCEKMALKPGTVTRMSVGYAPWSAPLGWLHCEPQFEIEQMETCVTPMIGDLPPTFKLDGMAKFDTGTNVHLDGDLNTKVFDPENKPLTYKLLPLYGPKHGKLALNPNGTFAYDPSANYAGEERFYVSASDGANKFTFEVMIAVGIDSGSMFPTPTVSIDKKGIVVDQRYHMVSFPVAVSPAAQPCEVWRLTVLQAAMSCECYCYSRTDCFDIGIAKC